MRIEKSVSSPSLPVVKTYTSPSGKVYTEPAANEAIHKGNFGDKVKDLQNKGKMVGHVKQVMQPAYHDWRTYKAERSAFEK